MATKWLNIYLKFSGLNYSLKKKLVEAGSWYRAVPYVLIIVIFELGFAIISIPLYLIVPPKKVQEEGFLFPAKDKAPEEHIRIYTARRKISLSTFFSAAVLFLIKAVFIGMVSLYLLGGQPLLAATQNWTFDIAGDYTYDSAKIEVTGGVAQLKNIGGTTSGSTTNSGFDSGSTGWTYADWLQPANSTAAGAYVSSGGMPGGYINIGLSTNTKNKTIAGLWSQSFVTSVNSPDTATLSFDWGSITYASPAAPVTYKLYAFIDTASGNPTIGQEVWSSGEITSTTNWASSTSINIASKVPTAGTYYLKIAAYVTTPNSNNTYNYVSGFDNAIVNWSKTTVSYASDSPAINPTASLNAPNVMTWNSFAETATKNGGEIYYQLSDNDGSTWQYWNGSAWAAAGATNYNAASVVNTNISTFSATNKKLMWKAFLSGNGAQQVILDNVAVTYTENDPPDIASIAPAEQTTNGLVYINYNLLDDNSDPSSLVTYQYSLTGAFAGEEVTMTASTTDPNHNGVSGLVSSPAGTAHTFVWDAQANVGNIYDASVYVRMRANDGIVSGAYATSTAFAVDYVVPIVSNVSASQVASTTNVLITYDLADDTTDNLNVEIDISEDGGATWTVSDTSVTGNVGAGVSAGASKTITWNAGVNFDEQAQNDLQVRVRARDKFQNQGTYASSANFTLDTLNPVSLAAANLESQPNAGDTTVLIGGSFTEANPDANNFYAAINGGAYGSATAGTANTAAPSNQSTAVGATLDGNDYISKVKITHTDDFGQSTDNENTSPSTSFKYVKPYTPAAPTLSNPVTDRLDLTINKNASETDGLEYAIFETTQNKFVQADGTLGASAVWQVLGTAGGQWGNNTGVSGKARVTGLTSPVANYIFKVKSRNTADAAHAASSESAYSGTAQITNTAPSISFGSIAQTTDGTQYVTVNYTGTDGQGDINSLNVYEYSQDNSTWSAMTEKSGVGSDGISNLIFLSGGSAHDFMWDSGADLPNAEDDTVYTRLRSSDTLVNSAQVTSSAFSVDNKVPVVSSISASQNAGARTVAITYTLTDNNNSTVEIDISENGGATWVVTDTSATGHIGAGVVPGAGKSITWNAGADFDNQYQTDLRVRVRARDTFGNQGDYAESANFTVDTKDPAVSNVTATQNAGADTFVFNYDVSEDIGNVTVSLEISANGGSTWVVPITSASGDVGSVTPGTGKTIAWNGAADYNNNEEQDMKIRVTADDSFTNSGNSSSANFNLDTYAPRVTAVSAAQTVGSTNVVITYTLADQNNSLVEIDISEDAGGSWTVIDTSVTGDVGAGQTPGAGKTITWAAGMDFNEQQQADMRVRVRGKDTFEHQGGNTFSANFSLDTLNPASLAAADLQSQPNAGATTVLIGGSFTEANPNTNDFYVAINDGAYGSVTAGTANTASPANQATAVGATLDGNDYISKAKITHTDDYGQTVDNENTSPNTSYKYVKPYTPAAPTVGNPTVGTVDVLINKNASETDGLEYAIYETTQNKYVQADGTLGDNTVWQSLTTWDTITVNGLVNDSYTYEFKIKSRNTSDAAHAASSESALSTGASSANQAPQITLGSISQTTDGTKYVTINYTGSDLESESSSFVAYEYSTNNSNWFTMTEKGGVGSDGILGLAFSVGGTAHDFMWDVGTDLANTEDSTVYIRLQANDGTSNGNITASGAFTIDTKNPVINPIASSQTLGSNNVAITYTLIDLSNSTVEIDISEDGGGTWAVTDTSVTGDIGAGIVPGAGKTVTWNTGIDFDNQEQNDMRVRGRALDAFGNQGSYAQSANFSIDTKNPVVSNVSAAQNTGASTVAITYDLTDANNSNVEIDISDDGGATWTVTDTSVTGHVGAGVTPGAGKTITWNAGADFSGQDQLDIRVRARATDIYANAGDNVESANFSLDTLGPVIASVSASQTLNSNNVAITYNLTDNSPVTIEIDISDDDGATWTVTDTSVTGDIGAGVAQGNGKSITWNANADFTNQEQNDIKVRVRGLDSFNNSSGNIESANFIVDTKNPVVNIGSDLTSQPNAGDTTILISGSFTESNPNTNDFYVAINGGAYGSSTAGTANTATPADQATAIGATLDGNDYISKVKITHTDDYAHSINNENTSPAVGYKYVKPYTPAVPTVNNPQNTSVNIAINKNASETSGLEYAIYEVSQNKYVQSNGTLGASAVWRTEAVWGTVTVTGLISPVAQYSFQVKSRNTSDAAHAASSESALSSSGAISNTAPFITLNSVSQQTGGVNYVLINYTGADAQNDTNNLNIYEYSTDNINWSTMTEKSGVGSSGTSTLLFTTGGASFAFAWNSGVDLPGVEDSTVYVRLKSTDGLAESNTAVSSAFAIDNSGPAISNILVSQTPGTNNIVFQYDLSDNSGSNLTVEINISEDSGATWTVTDTSTTGNVGAGQTTGAGKTIVWDAGTDFDSQEQSDMRVRIRATDNYGNAGSYVSSSDYTVDTKNPVVSNVSASQTAGTNNVVISYDLTDGTSAGHSVQIDISDDAGATWTVTDTSTTGNVGAGQTTGAGKTIVWDAGADFGNEEQSDMRIRVRSLDYYGNQGDYAQSSNFIIDTKDPVIANVSAAQNTGSTNVIIGYDLADNSTSTIEIDISDDGGATWTVTETSVTGAVGAGVIPGLNKSITWNAKADFNGNYQTDMQIRVRALDGYNTGNYSNSANFSIDTKDPAVSATTELISQPNAGDVTALIGGLFAEDNPDINDFNLAINGGAYGATTAGDSNTASPGNQAVAIGAVLDGNDYISKIKLTHVDDFGNSTINENTNPSVSLKYVKPYTPVAPTVNNPTANSVDVTVNKNASETAGLEYAIYENATGQYVQANGSLGTSAVWQTEAVWGTVTVTGLSSPVSNYVFKTKSRNTSDAAHSANSESSLSAGANIGNTAPSITINSVSQVTNGAKYAIINYTGTDAQNNSSSLAVYEYSTDNATWLAMTEKSGVGSSGTSTLLFTAAGTNLTFAWDTNADLPNTEDSTVYVRLKANDGSLDGNLETSSAFAVDTANPSIANFGVAQTAGTANVSITYDLTGTGSTTVAIDISEDSGATWTVTDTSVTGDIGAGQAPGTSKSIIWNAGADFNNEYQADMRARVRAIDDFGNTSGNIESSNFTVDTLDPIVSSVSASQTAGTNNVIITYSLNENVLSMVEIDISEDGGSTWTVADTSVTGNVGLNQAAGTGKTITWDAGIDFDGEYQADMKVRVRAIDFYGNTSGNIASANFTVDTKNPVLTNLSAAQTVGTVAVNYDLADDTSINLTVEIDISEDGGLTWLVSDTSVSGNIGTGIAAGAGKSITWNASADFGGQNQGDLRVRLRATDNAGNQAAYVESADFSLDTAAPTGLANLNKFLSTATTVTLNWTAAAETNFSHYEIWHGSSESDVNGRTGTADKWDNTDDANLADVNAISTVITGLNITGNYYVKIWAIDDYGNEATLAAINIYEAPSAPTPTPEPTAPITAGGGLIVAPDTVAPSKPILSPLTTPTNSSLINISGLAEPISSVELYDNGILVGRLSSLADGNGIFSQEFTFSEGSHLLSVKAIDRAGNISNFSDAVNLVIDKFSPETPVILSPKNRDEIADATPTFAGTAEPFAEIKIIINGNTFIAATGEDGFWRYILPSEYSLLDGDYELSAEAQDQAGNRSGAATIIFKKITLRIPPAEAGLPGAETGIPGTTITIPGTTITIPIPAEIPAGEIIPAEPIQTETQITEITEARELPGLPVPKIAEAGVAVSADNFRFTGTALPNKDIVVYIHSNEALVYKTKTDSKGVWNIDHSQIAAELTPGQHSIFAVMVDPEAKIKSRPSLVSTFIVEKSFWVSLYNLLNLETTIIVLLVIAFTMLWLYKIKRRATEVTSNV